MMCDKCCTSGFLPITTRKLTGLPVL